MNSGRLANNPFSNFVAATKTKMAGSVALMLVRIPLSNARVEACYGNYIFHKMKWRCSASSVVSATMSSGQVLDAYLIFVWPMPGHA